MLATEGRERFEKGLVRSRLGTKRGKRTDWIDFSRVMKNPDEVWTASREQAKSVERFYGENESERKLLNYLCNGFGLIRQGDTTPAIVGQRRG
jgi:hypothetical protein